MTSPYMKKCNKKQGSCESDIVKDNCSGELQKNEPSYVRTVNVIVNCICDTVEY